MFLIIIALFELLSGESFTGEKLFDSIISGSHLTILIEAQCKDCRKITEILESNNFEYNVLQTKLM